MKNINDYRESVISHYENGQIRGNEIGFFCLKDLITFKPKYSTYIQGYPYSGKTEIHLEILFNLTELYGWKHAIMSPEIGGVEDVIAELVSKYLRRQFYKSSINAPSELQIHQAITHLSEYFFVIDNDSKDYNVDNFYEDCTEIEKQYNIKLNTTSIDPWNDLDEDLLPHGGREDKYLAYALRKCRSAAKKNNWHNFIVTHSKDLPPIELKSVDGGKVVCTAIPTLQSFAGGQVWSRRAFNVIGMWRPSKGAINKLTGLPFADNIVMVKILKVKPKGCGNLGQAWLYFDWKKNRYYEEYDGKRCYSGVWNNEKSLEQAQSLYPVSHSLVDKPVKEKDLFTASTPEEEPLPF